MSDFERLETKKVRAVAALLETSTIAQAAQRCGMGESTLRRWLAEDRQFADLLKQNEVELLAEVKLRLSGLLVKAVSTLEEVLTSDESDAIRLRAACAVLDRFNQNKVAEQEERLTELERIVGYGQQTYLKPLA